MAEPKLSIVIPTFNRASTLACTIDRIESQTVPAETYEVIVIDNASTDDTRAVLEAKGRTHLNLKCLFQPKPGAAATRNAGLRQAVGDIVLFVDNDIGAERDLIQQHLEYHSQFARSAVIGTVLAPWNDSVDPFLRYLRHRGIYNPYTIASGPIDFSYYHTGNASTPRSLLIEVGGFNEDFFLYGMEDIELGYRLEKLGVRMINGDRARATHEYFPTYDEFIDRCEQAGYSLGKLIELHPDLEKRFVENGRFTKLLKRLHPIYRLSANAVESASRWLARREAGHGSTGPISRLLRIHYYWSSRYHFFLGYNQFRQHALSGNALHNVIQFGHRSLSDLALQRHKTSRSSARSARMS
jgi:glycosyltransferase involved in cell wall biosynthesis